MRSTASRLIGLLVLLMAAALLLSACGDDDEPAAEGTSSSGTSTAPAGGTAIADNYDLSGLKVGVGSKEFTEQLILGQMTKQALEAAGAEVDDQIGLGGSVAARNALTSGAIDMYWEYTGTGWLVHLGETMPVPGSQAQYQAVADRDLAENQIVWLAPAPADNSYQIAVRSEATADLGVTKISDLATLVSERPDEATICVGNEFSTRDDGLPGVQEAYGFQFPDGNVSTVQDGVVYSAVDKGDDCNFGSVFATDGRIPGLDLAILDDDKAFLPVYNPALNVRQDVLDANPDIRPLFEAIAATLDDATLQRLNASVDVDGESEDQVAEDFLRENGFIE